MSTFLNMLKSIGGIKKKVTTMALFLNVARQDDLKQQIISDNFRKR